MQILGIIVLVIGLFLFHLRSSLVAAVTLPLATIATFIAFWALDITINIMSLAGLILALGDMVDSAVVLTENAHTKIAADPAGKTPRTELVLAAARQLGPSIFGALLVLTVAYRPVLGFCLVHRHLVILGALVLTAVTWWPLARLGSEFMPPLYEGDLLYMPISVPSMPIETARRLLQWQDAQIRSVPEIAQVFGKAGRAETALDPAPLSMFETVVQLKPRGQWRPGMTQDKLIAELESKVATPGMQGAWTMPIKARIDMLSTGIRTPVGVKVFGPTLDGIAAVNDQLERVLRKVPGTRSVYAEREMGGLFLDITPDRQAIARYGLSVRDVLDTVESALGGQDVATAYEGRERYQINVRYPRELRGDVEAIRAIRVPVPALLPRATVAASSGKMTALGQGAANRGMGAPMGGGMGESQASVAAAMPSDGGGGMGPAAAAGSPAPPASRRAWLPLGELARVETVAGPPMLKSEMGQLAGWVYVDLKDRDVGSYVDAAKVLVGREVKLPPGYTLKWTGQYELLERVRARMVWLLPLTLALVFLILYLNFRGVPQVLLVMSGVPFAAVGAIWLLWLANYNTSIAVWVGMIGLLGVAAETASVMVAYLDEGWAGSAIRTTADLIAASVEAGCQRVRPLIMTVATNILGLLPLLLDDGVGADVAKRIAAPMWGGLVSLTLLTLLVVPAMYVVWRGRQLGPAQG